MRAKKSLGQNFLVDGSTAARIISAVAPAMDEAILEIGPGRGALTRLLLERAGLVLAVEIDEELGEWLKTELRSDRLMIIEADILAVDLASLLANVRAVHTQLQPRVRVVANLPYYISTAVLTRLITARALFKDFTLMLQREVAERIISSPGSREYGVLSVMVQLYCQARRLFHVSPGAFRPIPKVDSTVLHLDVREVPIAPVADEALLTSVVQAAFSQRRKTIINSLKSAIASINPYLTPEQVAPILQAAAIEPIRRAETLSPLEYIHLSNAFLAAIQPH
ncbi:MAG: 16S rRNA (adenine(1518)-N(6)/adenine(1519)-N(6))-dimethyltransferase RsmA [Acidobacteriota bacterium]